jgi:hypothetical protein
MEIGTMDVQDAFKALLDELLALALGDIEAEDIEVPELFEHLQRVATYEEAGVLTRDAGVKLRFGGEEDGTFHLTISGR